MAYDASDRLNGVACGLVSALIWGAFPVVTRMGLQHTPLGLYDITFIRYSVSGLLLLPFLARRGLRGLKWKPIGLMVLGIGAPYMLVVSQGLAHAPVQCFAVVTPGSMIVFSVMSSSYFLTGRLAPRELAGIAAIIAGAALTGYQSFSHTGSNELYTYVIFVVGGLMWAMYTISTKMYSVGSMHATAIVSVFSMVLYTPFYVLMRGDAILQAPLRDIAVQAVYQGVFVSTIALFFYSKAVFFLGPSIGSTFAALVPGAAVVLAGVMLDEQPTPVAIVGLFVVTVGMILTLVKRSGPRPAMAVAPKRIGC